MIYYPTNVFPKNTTVDGAISNNFSIVFNGDKLAMYKVTIESNDTGDPVYVGETISATAYNGETVQIQIPANTVTNGMNYLWGLRLYQQTANIFVANGYLCAAAAAGVTTLKMRSHPSADSGMYIKIGSEMRLMETYHDAFLIDAGTISAVTSPTVFTIDTGLTMPTGNTQAVITIDDEDRDVLSYNPTTGQVEINAAFGFALSTTKTYDLKDPSYGEATLSEGFTDSLANGTAYTIYSNFLDTPRSYFQARTTPQISINTFYTDVEGVHTVDNRTVTFEGMYAQAEGVEIKHHRFNIYSGTDIIYTTGDIYTSKLEYTYDGFRSDHTYGVEMTCETQDDVVVTTGIIYFNVVYTAPPGLDTSVVPTAEYHADTHAVHISYAAAVPSQMTNVIGFEIYRVEAGEHAHDPVQHKVAEVGADVFDVYDYLVQNSKTYEWVVIPMTTDKYCVALTSNTVTLNWSDWAITSLNPNGTDYTADETWSLALNVTPDTAKQNINKSIMVGYAKYPKTVIGEHNYISGAATALLGNIGQDGRYNEGITRLAAWRKFTAQGKDCLIKDTKGNIYIVQLSDFGESSFAPKSKELPTQISFVFTEIRSTQNIAVYGLS